MPSLRSSRWKLAVAVLAAYSAYALSSKPVLLASPGEWDCACGRMYINTTRHVLWNPLRDRKPEIVANNFLANLRANQCFGTQELCANALPKHRISNWRLTYREDGRSSASLFFKLAKYNSVPEDLNGVGAVSLQKGSEGWIVTNFDAVF